MALSQFKEEHNVVGYTESLDCSIIIQGSHRLEKYLNLEDFLEMSLKIKYALKSTGKITQRP